MSEATTDQWDEVAFVTSSQYRKRAIMGLNDQPQMPSEIADDDIAHISRALGELRERGLAELLVSEDTKKGRIHGLTEKGGEIAALVEQRA